jgi:hypothetical protein
MAERAHDVGFIFSCIRSGSTLLRSILNAHPDIHAPHELHLGFLEVGTGDEYTRQSLAIAGLSLRDLRAILWSGIYDRLRQASGKSMLIDKSPSNAAFWDEISAIWPGAPAIVLKRNPAAIAYSIVRANDGRDLRAAREHIVRSMDLIDRVIATSESSVVVKYEDIIADPERILKELLGFLGFAFDPRILEYLSAGGGPFEYGVGDWGDAIRSGVIQRDRNAMVPAEIAAHMADCGARWGY